MFDGRGCERAVNVSFSLIPFKKLTVGHYFISTEAPLCLNIDTN